MDDTVEKAVVVGLVVSAVAAPAFIAYSRPKQYEKVGWKLVALSIVIQWMGAVWTFALSSAEAAVKHLDLGANVTEKVIDTIAHRGLPDWWLYVWFAVFAYLMLLNSLPWWLLDKPSTNASNTRHPFKKRIANIKEIQ